MWVWEASRVEAIKTKQEVGSIRAEAIVVILGPLAEGHSGWAEATIGEAKDGHPHWIGLAPRRIF